MLATAMAWGEDPERGPRIYTDPINGSPASYGLDSDKGVMYWDQHNRRPYAVAAGTLASIFGPAWRTQVYV